MDDDRARRMTLLCATKVRSRICMCGKEHLEVVDWCLVSPCQVRIWIQKGTNISMCILWRTVWSAKQTT